MGAPKGKKHKYPKKRQPTKRTKRKSTDILESVTKWREENNKPSRKSVWLIHSKRTREMIFSTPEILREEFDNYVQFCIENPWIKHEKVVTKFGATLVEVPQGKPVTIMGFLVFCEVGENYWRNFRHEVATSRADFGAVLDYIALTTRNENIEGAAMGAYNGNIIARLHGLTDTVNVNNINQEDSERKQVQDIFPKKLRDPKVDRG